MKFWIAFCLACLCVSAVAQTNRAPVTIESVSNQMSITFVRGWLETQPVMNPTNRSQLLCMLPTTNILSVITNGSDFNVIVGVGGAEERTNWTIGAAITGASMQRLSGARLRPYLRMRSKGDYLYRMSPHSSLLITNSSRNAVTPRQDGSFRHEGDLHAFFDVLAVEE